MELASVKTCKKIPPKQNKTKIAKFNRESCIFCSVPGKTFG